ncbi:MAG: hypothetical protein Q9221_007024 [Calogaya cf. arnoldii]
MSTLLEPLDGRKPTKRDLNSLHGDSQLVIIAGSDTTATALTCAVLEMARNPDQQRKLRKELAPYMRDRKKDVANQDIVKCEHLNGVIYEALRLYPPVPTAIERKTPPEGMEIGGQHIPGNMIVWCSPFVTGRKEEIYTNANAFVPERWDLHPDMVKEKSAWPPFSAGEYTCNSPLVMTYDISFPAGNPDAGRKCEANMKDHFTLAPGELEICSKRL